jgi:hypothetical protein
VGAIVAKIDGFEVSVVCSRHQRMVVGNVLDLGVRHGKCLESRNWDCCLYWYVEVVFTEFEKPEVEGDTRPAS